MTATTVDLKRELAEIYSAAATPALVQVPELRFLMIDGHGDPNTSPGYTAAVEALYTVAYTIRFALKRGPAAVDAPVMPLEGLWWTPDMAAFSVEDKASWNWTMMIALPPQATPDVVADARAEEVARGDRPGTGGVPRRGPGRARPAPWALPRRRAHGREPAPVRRGAGLPPDRQAPRDLPRRSAAGGAGEAPDDHPPARRPGLGHGVSARSRSRTDDLIPLSGNRRRTVGTLS
jgi:hypothetical protein